MKGGNRSSYSVGSQPHSPPKNSSSTWVSAGSLRSSFCSSTPLAALKSCCLTIRSSRARFAVSALALRLFHRRARSAARLNSGVRHVKNSVATVGATVLGLVVFVATLTLARHEYAKKLLSNAEATASWKESDSVSGAIIHSHVIEQLNNGDKASALQALCDSLREDLRSL